MLIGKLAEATGVSRDTIRFYERKGMIKGHISSGHYKFISSVWRADR